MRIVRDIIKKMEDIAPSWIKCDYDNIGLQVGNYKNQVQNILLALDCTDDVVEEAIANNCQMIITHHPRIFDPISNLSESNLLNKILVKLIKNNISLYCAHTNLDMAKGGINDYLADIVKISKNRKPMSQEVCDKQYKVVVFTPANSIEKIQNAVYNNGGGKIGNYTNCSFTSYGEGTFYANEDCSPTIGDTNNSSKVEEGKVEFIVSEEKLSNVLAALKNAHCYETPAIEIFPLKDTIYYGLGIVGKLESATSLKEICELIKEETNSPMVQYFGKLDKKVSKIGVWSGTGFKSNFASRHKLDLIITGDINYHILEALEDEDCAAIAVGHAHIEAVILPVLQKKLSTSFPDANIIVSKSNLYSLINF